MNFQKKISSGEFVVLAEMDTPKGVDISELIINVRRIQGRVDAVVIPGMDSGVMRMSAIGGGALTRREGMEAVIHVCCRDRNRMALQGDILAAHALGIRNVVVVPAESMEKGDHRDAKPSDDLDETELVRAIRSLNSGTDMSGFELNGRPGMTIGCAISPFGNEKEMARQLKLANEKVRAGAEFVITPPVFDLERFKSFFENAKLLGVPVIPTVFLLKSVGIARYMANYEPGAHISEDMIRRIRKAPDREQECLKIAGETIAALRDVAQGVKIQTLGWESHLPAILRWAGI
ncbi:Methylenetetrahydrofolate reductase [Candidatus Desulfarcum epimagneticum]|uniref:Methylenetetrahydrofolate reductase n=1 Tax=uncultured Desulfobacteraceae bacterium TaxID=218296 RepID=A0A484HHQ3_9BACT|nr:Methylenetetrahydrofolate reductase [uncultured Desulfobacteraceae bacterium]